jgi:hypothetical protein
MHYNMMNILTKRMADQDVPSWPPPTLSPALPVAQYKNERKMLEEIDWTKTQD